MRSSYLFLPCLAVFASARPHSQSLDELLRRQASVASSNVQVLNVDFQTSNSVPSTKSFSVSDPNSSVKSATCAWPKAIINADPLSKDVVGQVPVQISQPCDPATFQYQFLEFDSPANFQLKVSHAITKANTSSTILKSIGFGVASLSTQITGGKSGTAEITAGGAATFAPAPAGWVGDSTDLP